MVERDDFSFNTGNLGIMSTEELDPIAMGESFLGSDPEDLKFIGLEKEEEAKKAKEKKEKEEKEEKEKQSSKDNKEKKEVKEVIVPPKEVDEEDLYSSLEGKGKNKEKEEGDEEVSDDKEVKTTTSGEDELEENPYQVIANEMLNQGIFVPDQDEEGNESDLEITTPEQLLQRFQLEARREAAEVVDKFLARHGEDYKDMFEAVFVKGVPPVEYLGRYTRIENLKELDLTDEGNQERIVRELYKQDGRSSDYIEKQITKHKNYSDLADEATEAQRILIEREQKANETSAANKQAEIARRQDIRNQYLSNVGKILTDKLKAKEFDSIPVDKKFADQTYKYITQERYNIPSTGQVLTEFDKDVLDLARPENHELKVKIAMLLQLAKEDPQLGKLAKKAVSKESNELFQGLGKQALRTKSTTTSTKKTTQEKEEEPKSWFVAQ